jgi:putative methanogen marker protein 4
MGIIKTLQGLAKSNYAKVGIGVGEHPKAAQIVKKSMKYAAKLEYAETVIFNSGSEMISALKDGDIAAAVRGTLSAKETLGELKKVFKIVSIYRSALICINEKNCFFLAPVGIDEGIFIDERLQFIKLIDSQLQRLGISSKISIISGGRLEDFGRSGLVDESLQAGKKLFYSAKDEGFDVTHNGILIEEAYKDSNIIIAPNGIVGNLLFRTLNYLGNARSFGAPILNLDEIFIDTSRSKEDYTDSIMMASALSGIKND